MSSSDPPQSQTTSNTPLSLSKGTSTTSTTSDKPITLNVSAQPYIPKKSTINTARNSFSFSSQYPAPGYTQNPQRYPPMQGFQQPSYAYPTYYPHVGMNPSYQDGSKYQKYNYNNSTTARNPPLKGTPLSLDMKAKPFVPKNKPIIPFYPKSKQEGENKEKVNEDIQPKEEEKPSPPIIERMYFIINSKSPSEQTKQSFTVEYITSFQKWSICNETTLLSKTTIDHLDKLKTKEEEGKPENKQQKKSGDGDKKFERKYQERRSVKLPSSFNLEMIQKSGFTPVVGMQQWGRKDISKEVQEAEQFKEKLEERKKIDPIKADLKELLNALTVDNYVDIKKQIYDLIQDDTEKQFKFLDVLFRKAVNEKTFVSLYAKLCKELDKELPQKAESKDQNIKKNKATSQMRSKLVERCREIFKIEKNEIIDNYIRVSDPTERENKMKNFILGNANFISELIKAQVLSRKIAFQCIDNLFKRLENQSCDEMLKFVYLEAIVLFTDKFGTLIVNQKDKISNEDWEDFQKRIQKCLSKLNEIQLSMSMPGHVKYKIINLIEKEKTGWELSSYEKSNDAKGKDEIRKQYEESQQTKTEGKLNQEAINDKIREDIKDFQEFLDEGGQLEDYRWEIVDKLYSRGKCSLSSILNAFIEASIDLVKDHNTLNNTVQYWKEMMNFYAPRMSQNEKKDLVSCTLELISQVHSLSLDNPLLIDVWAQVLIILNNTDVMKYKLLRELKNLTDDDLISLFKVFKKIITENKDILSAIETISYVKDNKELFDDIKI